MVGAGERESESENHVFIFSLKVFKVFICDYEIYQIYRKG